MEKLLLTVDDVMVRKAKPTDLDTIWVMLQSAIEKRRLEGSDQWQDGYPNKEVVDHDIRQGNGYVLLLGSAIIAYVALIFDGEPAYEHIEGSWLTPSDVPYAVIHRLAVHQNSRYKGIGTVMMKVAEGLCLARKISTIKVDTNHDNAAMLHVFNKLGYVYCGEVVLRGNARRKGFQKRLD